MTGEWMVSRNGGSAAAPAPLRSRGPQPAATRSESWLLDVLLPGPGDYALAIPFPAEISAVYLGPAILWNSATADTGGSGSITIPFQADSSALIRVEVPAGGRSPGSPALTASPFLVGPKESLDSARKLAAVLAGIKLGAFGGAILVALLFSLFCHGGKGFLALAGFLAGALVFYAVQDFFVLALPAPPSAIADRLYMGAWSVQHALLAVLALALFPAFLKGAARTVLIVPPLLLAAAAAAPERFLVLVYWLSLGWAGLLYLTLILYTGLLTAKGMRRSLLFLFAVLSLLASQAARWVLGDTLLAARILEPAGTGLFCILATMTLIRMVGDAFDEAENLTAYMDSVTSTVRRFIPAEFIEYLQKSDINDLRLGDHVEKEMTIFFSDIRHFTQLAEGLTTEEIFAFINSYLARMVPIIKESGGFVDKYVGDAIMALFPDRGGADQAVRTALEMQTRILEYNRHRASVGYRPIEMGIGIHTGTLMLGVVGVQDRMENTVISDAVNLSSRLQAIAKAFNIGVVISEASFKSLEDVGLFKYRFIGKVRVKGRAAPVSCFEIFSDTQDAAFELKMKANTFFEQGMLGYYQKEFVDASYYFKRALEILPHDGAARFYLEACLRKTH